MKERLNLTLSGEIKGTLENLAKGLGNKPNLSKYIENYAIIGLLLSDFNFRRCVLESKDKTQRAIANMMLDISYVSDGGKVTKEMADSMNEFNFNIVSIILRDKKIFESALDIIKNIEK